MRHARARNAALLLGGFLDGIVLHQIGHWHQMLSARVPPHTVEAVKHNMSADGWFHLATWAVTLAGVLSCAAPCWAPGRCLRPAASWASC